MLNSHFTLKMLTCRLFYTKTIWFRLSLSLFTLHSMLLFSSWFFSAIVLYSLGYVILSLSWMKLLHSCTYKLMLFHEFYKNFSQTLWGVCVCVCLNCVCVFEDRIYPCRPSCLGFFYIAKTDNQFSILLCLCSFCFCLCYVYVYVLSVCTIHFIF